MEIAMWTEPWVPKQSYFLPTPRASTIPLPSIVAEFILPNLEWDLHKVLATFEASDAAIILALPLSDRCTSDRRIWSPDSKGCFTVKSTYRIVLELQSSELLPVTRFHSSNLCVPLWKNIWHAHIPASAKVCIWKAGVDILPTRECLVRKQVELPSTLCVLCNEVSESSLHLCCQCSFSRSVFHTIPGSDRCYPDDFLFSTFLEWLLHCSQVLPKESFHRLLFLIWCV